MKLEKAIRQLKEGDAVAVYHPDITIQKISGEITEVSVGKGPGTLTFRGKPVDPYVVLKKIQMTSPVDLEEPKSLSEPYYMAVDLIQGMMRLRRMGYSTQYSSMYLKKLVKTIAKKVARNSVPWDFSVNTKSRRRVGIFMGLTRGRTPVISLKATVLSFVSMRRPGIYYKILVGGSPRYTFVIDKSGSMAETYNNKIDNLLVALTTLELVRMREGVQSARIIYFDVVPRDLGVMPIDDVYKDVPEPDGGTSYYNALKYAVETASPSETIYVVGDFYDSPRVEGLVPMVRKKGLKIITVSPPKASRRVQLRIQRVLDPSSEALMIDPRKGILVPVAKVKHGETLVPPAPVTA